MFIFSLIYRNSIETNLKLSNLRIGEECLVVDSNNNYLARGFYNSHSIYSIRILVRKSDKQIPFLTLKLEDILKIKILNAFKLRKLLLFSSSITSLSTSLSSNLINNNNIKNNIKNNETNVFRLIHGEGDGLSGLIVDIMKDSVVVQSSAYWVEYHREIIEKQLKEVLLPYFPSMKLIWTGVKSRLFADGWNINHNNMNHINEGNSIFYIF